MSKTRYGDTPGPLPVQVAIPATASNTNLVVPVYEAPFACVAKNFRYVPSTTFAGHDTDRRNLNVIYKGADGSTGAAEVANLDLTATPAVGITAFDSKAIPLNATYVNGVTLAEGETLAFELEDIGTGSVFGAGILAFDVYPS